MCIGTRVCTCTHVCVQLRATPCLQGLQGARTHCSYILLTNMHVPKKPCPKKKKRTGDDQLRASEQRHSAAVLRVRGACRYI